MTQRTFIALPLPADCRVALAALSERLQRCAVPARWVPPEQLHLTLKFLGDIGDEQLSGVLQAIREVAADYRPFRVKLDGCGFFPHRGKPRVLYAGVTEEERIAEIVRDLERRLEPLGFPAAERFSAHITLARLKDIRHLADLRREVARTPPTQSFSLSALSVYTSTLSSRGAQHHEVEWVALGEAGGQTPATFNADEY